MDSSKLYRTQLYLLKLYGFLLSYESNWKGNLIKLFAFFAIFSNVVGLVLHSFYIAFERHTVEEFADGVN